jgi:hypothetical protein
MCGSWMLPKTHAASCVGVGEHLPFWGAVGLVFRGTVPPGTEVPGQDPLALTGRRGMVGHRKTPDPALSPGTGARVRGEENCA